MSFIRREFISLIISMSFLRNLKKLRQIMNDRKKDSDQYRDYLNVHMGKANVIMQIIR